MYIYTVDKSMNKSIGVRTILVEFHIELRHRNCTAAISTCVWFCLQLFCLWRRKSPVCPSLSYSLESWTPWLPTPFGSYWKPHSQQSGHMASSVIAIAQWRFPSSRCPLKMWTTLWRHCSSSMDFSAWKSTGVRLLTSWPPKLSDPFTHLICETTATVHMWREKSRPLPTWPATLATSWSELTWSRPAFSVTGETWYYLSHACLYLL